MVKNSPAMQEAQVWSLGWEKSPGEGNGNPLQYSCLGNPTDRWTWQATVHRVTKSQTWLSDRACTILKVKLQYFGHLMQRADSLEKTLMMGKIEGKRRRGRQRIRWLDSITSSIDMNLNKHQEIVEDRAGWHAAVHGVTKSQTWLSDWTTKTPDPRLHGYVQDGKLRGGIRLSASSTLLIRKTKSFLSTSGRFQSCIVQS